jgi:hypothetical protein
MVVALVYPGQFLALINPGGDSFSLAPPGSILASGEALTADQLRSIEGMSRDFPAVWNHLLPPEGQPVLQVLENS